MHILKNQETHIYPEKLYHNSASSTISSHWTQKLQLLPSTGNWYNLQDRNRMNKLLCKEAWTNYKIIIRFHFFWPLHSPLSYYLESYYFPITQAGTKNIIQWLRTWDLQLKQRRFESCPQYFLCWLCDLNCGLKASVPPQENRDDTLCCSDCRKTYIMRGCVFKYMAWHIVTSTKRATR